MARVHLLCLLNDQVTAANSVNAFTQKNRRLADMLSSLGHEVFVYASEDCDAQHAELITCITKREQKKWFGHMGEQDVFNLYDNASPWWQKFTERAIRGIRKRMEPNDFIAMSMGFSHKPVADAFPELIAFECGIGYSGVCADYRVYESWAWRSFLQAREPTDRHRAYDTVISNSFHEHEYPFQENHEGYYAFVGRLIEGKGPHVAALAAARAGVPLVVAGQGVAETRPGYIRLQDGTELTGDVTYLGVLGPDDRTKVLQGAVAVYVPSQYFEPFGMVSVEAQAVGTPVICSNWGGLPENVIHGTTGYLCDTLDDYVWATKDAVNLKRSEIAEHARWKWSTENVKWKYDDYLEKLSVLYGGDWYTLRDQRPDLG